MCEDENMMEWIKGITIYINKLIKVIRVKKGAYC
jgi:hypothetical protein